MTISALEVGRRADALVQLLRSDAPLDQAYAIMDGISAEDRADITQAFVARAWEDDGEPVPVRGARLQDWLVGLRATP